MFILKFFSRDGSYTVHSCDSYQIHRSDGRRCAVFGTQRVPIEQKLIVENGEGQTVDVLRGNANGLV